MPDRDRIPATNFDHLYTATYGANLDETHFDLGELWEAYAAGWKEAGGPTGNECRAHFVPDPGDEYITVCGRDVQDLPEDETWTLHARELTCPDCERGLVFLP